MYLLLIILIVIAAILMCFIVLIQNSKGGGLASGFSSSNQIMGVRKTTDFLEKTTWALAIWMVVLSIATAYVLPFSTGGDGNIIMEQARQEDQTNPMNLPGFATPTEIVPEAFTDSTSN
ncbi:MAG: preprotein translocase subunit SecG [Mediterranea sp.]|jgi:preprotein translocase subunit SecG|nr:preprotein translocase subunit SecG [Mediterranea sp.]